MTDIKTDKTLHFYKAQSSEDLTLVFDRQLPELTGKPGESVTAGLAKATTFYQEIAKSLAQLLLATLPGGVFDQLLCEMLKIKASHFRVAFSPQRGRRGKREHVRI